MWDLRIVSVCGCLAAWLPGSSSLPVQLHHHHHHHHFWVCNSVAISVICWWRLTPPPPIRRSIDSSQLAMEKKFLLLLLLFGLLPVQLLKNYVDAVYEHWHCTPRQHTIITANKVPMVRLRRLITAGRQTTFELCVTSFVLIGHGPREKGHRRRSTYAAAAHMQVFFSAPAKKTYEVAFCSLKLITLRLLLLLLLTCQLLTSSFCCLVVHFCSWFKDCFWQVAWCTCRSFAVCTFFFFIIFIFSSRLHWSTHCCCLRRKWNGCASDSAYVFLLFSKAMMPTKHTNNCTCTFWQTVWIASASPACKCTPLQQRTCYDCTISCSLITQLKFFSLKW